MGSATATLATVPAGEVWIVKEVAITSNHLASGEVTIMHGDSGFSSFVAWITANLTTDPDHTIRIPVWTVLEAGDAIYGAAPTMTTGEPVMYWVSGARLIV